MNYLLRKISESTESIAGLSLTYEQNYPRQDRYVQTYAEHCEFSYDEILIDMEEGRLTSDGRAEPAAEVKFDSKHYGYYLLTTTCGICASAFSFIDGLIFVIQCPENWVLACLLMLMGALGTMALLCVILKLLGKGFDGFRRYEELVIHTSFVILILQWLMDVYILYLKDARYNYSAKVYCSPKFYGYTILTNLVAVLAFLVHYIMYIHRRRIV